MPANCKDHISDIIIIRHVQPSQISDQTQLDEFESWLDSAEMQRLQRLRKTPNRQRFLVSHALMRQTLAEQAGCHPWEVEFMLTQHGKPAVRAPATLTHIGFNLTHSHDMAAIALCRTGPVGIDLEYLNRTRPSTDLARRYFTLAEYQDIIDQPALEQHIRLLTYWTLKEAYIKAEGWGLSIGLDSFEFELAADGIIKLRILDPSASPSRNWQFQLLNLGKTYLGALAAPVADSKASNPGIDLRPWNKVTGL